MALYPLNDFKSLVSSENWTYFNEKRPFRHLEKLGWGRGELVDVLCSLEPADFRKTFQAQIVNTLPNMDTIDADHYVIHWDMDEWVRRTDAWVQGHYPSLSTVELSIKIAIAQNEDGQLAGVVTFHESNSWD